MTRTKILPLIIGIFTLINMPGRAQESDQKLPELKIGYVNSIALLEQLPQKQEAEATLKQLSQKYEQELAYMQNDYNKKYADFMSYQSHMGDNIKLRRMQELTELERQINDFMKVSQQDIKYQESQLIEPLRKRLQQAINAVGIEHGFICIYDTASPSVAFITPTAINVDSWVLEKFNAPLLTD